MMMQRLWVEFLLGIVNVLLVLADRVQWIADNAIDILEEMEEAR